MILMTKTTRNLNMWKLFFPFVKLTSCSREQLEKVIEEERYSLETIVSLSLIFLRLTPRVLQIFSIYLQNNL